MKALATAIYAYASTGTNSLKTAVSGRINFAEASQNWSYPYVVYSIPSIEPDHYFGGDRLERALVTIDLFSDSQDPAEIANLTDYARSLFDNALISVSGYSRVQFRWEQTISVRMSDTGVWRCSIDYDVILGA